MPDSTDWTAEQRILCALSREAPDRVPIYDLVSSRALIRHSGGEALTLENAGELIPRALRRCLDMTRVFLPEAPGKRVDAQGFSYERTDWFNEWQVGAPFADLDGLKRFIGAEIDRLEGAPPPGDTEREHAEALAWKRRFGETVIPASWAGEPLQDAYIRVGLDWFVWLDNDAPELARRWIDALHHRLMLRLQAEIRPREISPVAWIFADVAYKNRLMFSPAFLRRRGFFERLAEICDLYHARDLKVIFHSDGDILKIMPDLLHVGVDAVAPVDTAAGMTLPALKQAFGKRVAFVGGVDAESVLRNGSPHTIRAAVRDLIEAAAPGGGLVLGASSEELFEDFPLENILAFHEAVHEYGRYPNLGRTSGGSA
jgi:uroporphyrinogen decarboxylase